MFTYINQPQSPIRVILDGFRLFKTSFFKAWLWQLFLTSPPIILAALLRTSQDMAVVSGRANTDIEGAISAAVVILSFLALFGVCAVYYRIHCIAIQSSCGFKAVMRVVLYKVWLAMVITIICYLVMGLMGLLADAMVFLLSAAGFISAPVLTHTVEALLVVVIIYLIFLQNICIVSLLVDDLSLFQAIKQGCLLMWGQGLRTLSVLGMSWILLFLVLFLLLAVLGITVLENYPATSIVLMVVSVTLGALFPYGCVLTQLHDLKLRYAMKRSARVDS
jgi:hypothetical protein